MTDVQVKLNDHVPDFKYFAEDQILTADDLNRVVDFLDRQQRMTRTYTLGVGIVCGLAPNRLSFGRISVSKGAAVTTDGDLLVLQDDTLYTHFAVFQDPDAKYTPFRKANGQLIQMWELATENGPGLTSLSQFTGPNNPNFDDLVVLLYLESYLEPEEECEGQDCDKRGDRQVRNLKVLLARRADVADSAATPVRAAAALPVLTSARVNLRQNRITRYRGTGGLADRYRQAIGATRDQFLDAVEALGKSAFKPMLDAVVSREDRWETLFSQARFRPGVNTRRAQYVYDLYRDLAAAYNEWRECACQLPVECLPDPDGFAKHVVLGEPHLDAATAQLTRHFFRPSSLLQDDGHLLKRCFFLLRRIDVMIRSFHPNRIDKLRITPSKSYCHPLATRAIPYYFDVDNDVNPRDVWSFAAHASGTSSQIFSYHANEDAQASAVAKQPFQFDIAPYEFLRIEGHLDRTLDDVEDELETLAKTHNLAFQVMAVAVDDLDKLDRVKLPPRLRFPDLDAMFRLKKIDVLNSVRDATDFGVFAKTQINQVQTHAQKQEAKTHIESFNVEMVKTVQLMPRTLNDFTLDKTLAFKSSLDKSYNFAEDFERVSADLFRPTKVSPIQTFLEPKRFRDFGLLFELYDKRKKKVQEQLLFANFLDTYPGLEHLGGVPVGGTFILVYEADSKIVFADFSLPYNVCLDANKLEPEDLEEPTEPPLQPLPLPIPKPPIEFKPPFIFNPKPWVLKNSFKIDTLRGDLIKTELEKTKTDLVKTFDQRFGDAKLTFGKEINDNFAKAKTDFASDISNRIQQNKAELNQDFEVKINQARTTFKTEVDSKIESFKFDPKDRGFNVGDFVAGGNVAVDPNILKIVEDLNETRETQVKLQTKRALGAELSLEEKAALTQADARLTNLVIEATKQPALSKTTLDANARGLVETIRHVSLGIEGKANRNKLVKRFDAIPAASTTSKELKKIRNVLVRP